MPAMDEDDRPKKKIVHEIGQDSRSFLSGSCMHGSRCSRRRSRGSPRTLRESSHRATSPTIFSRNRGDDQAPKEGQPAQN